VSLDPASPRAPLPAARRPVAIVLAAGAARRYGRAKQVETLADGNRFVQHAARAALAVADDVRVIVGAHREAVIEALAGIGVQVVDNPDWARGMGRSIAAGFASLIADGVDRPALLCLADQPRVGAEALRRLLDVAAAHPDAIIVSDYGSTRGPPCLFPPRCFAELAALDGDEGARAVLKAHAATVQTVWLPEGLDDVDTEADYRRIVQPNR